MSETKFTPGPWSWWTSNSMKRLSAGRSDGNVLHAYRCSDGVADVSVSDADAHLIAAAPELYEAVAEAFEREYNPFEPDNQSDRYHRWGALLAKARGESNG